jgi:hypothetical protein
MLVTQSRIASLSASLSVREPEVTDTTRAPEQTHPIDVRLLARDVDLAHVDDAFQPEPRRDGRARHPVLTGAGLGDDAGLAHPPREQGLTDGVVDLVRAGVIEILALEKDLRAAELAAPALGVIEGRGPADIVRRSASSSAWNCGSAM